MQYPLLAVAEGAPLGFELHSQLSSHDIRRSAFALFAESVEAAEAALGESRAGLVGLIVTWGDRLIWQQRDAGLYHMAIPRDDPRRMPDLLVPLLDMLQRQLELSDLGRQQTLDLSRAVEDRTRLVREFSELRESLLKELSERRSAERELLAYRGHLEDLVQQRTAELAEANAELLRARDAAEAASRAKSTFLANMSHEIRTPLNGIIGMTELVLKSQLLSQQREFLWTVRDSGETLLSVINDILDFSKIEAGKMTLDSSTFNLHESLGDTMKSFALRADQRGLELACAISPEVPTYVVGDYPRLRQILVNLIGNALKFTEHGEVVLEVTVDSSITDRMVLHCVVRDTGVGIPPDKLAAIFEPFEQVDTSLSRRHGGTGLGLAIATRLVTLMGGRIWVESEPDQGSRFHFTAEVQPAAAPPAAQPVADLSALRGLRVLVVDDNATNRRILDGLLRSWQMVPSAAGGAAEAMELLRQSRMAKQPQQLLLVDAHMPVVDGFTFVEQIRQDPELAGAVVMMLSSGQSPDDTVRCDELGVAAHLLKPIRESELLQAIGLALGIAPSATVQAAAAEPHHGKPLRVLLAEDSPVNQKLAVALLEAQGHQVTVVSNGREALAALEGGRFDVVLMDVQMPEMDGLEATGVIRDRERQTGGHVPVIAMTAHALAGDRERCLAAGMDDYIAKPVHSRELYRAVESAAAIPVGSGSVPQSELVAPVGATTSVEALILDQRQIMDRLEGNVQTLSDLVDLFAVEGPRLLGDMSGAIKARDRSRLRRAAHTFKGSLALFGHEQGVALAVSVEEAGKAADFPAADHACARLATETQRLLAALRNMVAGLRQPSTRAKANT